VNLRSGAAYEVVGCYVFTALEAPQQHESVVPIHALRRDPHAKVVSLEDCVEAFLQPEQLSEADEWYCPKCKTHVQVGAVCCLWYWRSLGWGWCVCGGEGGEEGGSSTWGVQGE
jgi:hypothetical protein